MANHLPDAARAIIIKDGNMVVIKRTRPGRKYMVTPGGRREPGETLEETLFRELAEETTVEVANPRLVFIEDPNDESWGMQYIFLCDYVSGEPQLHPDSEELLFQSQGNGTYEPTWYPIDQIPDPEFKFRSSRLGQEIITAFKDGFPSEPKHWQLNPPVVK